MLNKYPNRIPNLSQANLDLKKAVKLYENDQFDRAYNLLKVYLKDEKCPLEVLECAALSLYREGSYFKAAELFERFGEKAKSYEHVPELMDCYRALGDYSKMKRIYFEFIRSKPKRAFRIEATLVYAGSLRDRGRMEQALQALSKEKINLNHPDIYELRLMYLLGDIYEKMGNFAQAKKYFSVVAKYEPDLADVSERVTALQ